MKSWQRLRPSIKSNSSETSSTRRYSRWARVTQVQNKLRLQRRRELPFNIIGQSNIKTPCNKSASAWLIWPPQKGQYWQARWPTRLRWQGGPTPTLQHQGTRRTTSRMPWLLCRASNSLLPAATTEAPSRQRAINKTRRIQFRHSNPERMLNIILPRTSLATQFKNRFIMARNRNKAIPRRCKINHRWAQSDLAAPLQLQALPRCRDRVIKSPAYAVINPRSSH